MHDRVNAVNDRDDAESRAAAGSSQESVMDILRWAESTRLPLSSFSITTADGTTVTLELNTANQEQSDPDGDNQSTTPKGLLGHVERGSKGLELAATAAAGLLGVIVTAVELRRSGRKQG